MPSPFSLNLGDPGDCPAESNIISALEDLVGGVEDPTSTARRIDEIITLDCQEAYDSYTSAANPAAEQGADDSIRGPEPAGWQKFLWDCLGKAAMKIPADSEGQDRLVALLRELQQLPRHRVPELVHGKLGEKELWSLTPANGYEGLGQWLWELDQGRFTGWQQIDSDPQAATQYINFSSFLARLLASGVAEATRLCALIRPSTFATRSPASNGPCTDTNDAARLYDPSASAAAQWILYAADALYEMCYKGALVEIGRQRWTRSLWDSWKVKFDAVSKDARFRHPVRDWAARAFDRMCQVENHVGGGDASMQGVVEHFGFIRPEEEEEEEDE